MNIAETILKLKSKPERVRDLAGREFEEVVAELLASFGWRVNLTPPTKDGGYDMLALSADASGLESSWIIECKRYGARNAVRVDIARSIYGVKFTLGVSNAVIVTTSKFTKSAQEFSRSKYDLQFVDYSRVVQWLEQYTSEPERGLYLPGHRFYSCFISYSHRDERFAEELVARLRQAGIKIWYAPEDMRAGQKIHDQIKAAISQFDKLLIILSPSSMQSEWVRTELRNARKREIEENRRILFPISLVSMDVLRQWECFDADTGRDLACELREYLIPIFTNWHDPGDFDAQFRKVLQGLQLADQARDMTPGGASPVNVEGTWVDPADGDTAGFKQVGNRVVGLYDFDGSRNKTGVYLGTIRDRVLEYTWRWFDGTNRGQGRMLLSEDGQQLVGEWWYDDDPDAIEHVGYHRRTGLIPSWLTDSDFAEFDAFLVSGANTEPS